MSTSLWPALAPPTTGDPVEWVAAFVVALALTAVAGFLVAAEVAVTRVMSIGMAATASAPPRCVPPGTGSPPIPPHT